jgi:CHASE1-domain containing sensor protein
VAGVFALGIALTALVVAYNARVRRAAQQDDFTKSARTVANHMEQSLLAPLGTLHALHSLRRASPELDRAAFARFARPLMQRHPSLAALEWSEYVAGTERAAFEAKLSTELGRPAQIIEPDAQGHMRIATRRDHYDVLVRMEPEVESLLGFNIEFEPERIQTAQSAIAQGTMTVSAKMRLVEDPPDVFSIAVYEPVFRGDSTPSSPAERAQRIDAFAIALFRIAPLVRAALERADLSGADVALIDSAEGIASDHQILFQTRSGVEKPDEGSLIHAQDIHFAGRSWRVLLSRESHMPLGALLSWVGYGVLSSALCAGLMLGFARAARWRRKYQALKAMGQYRLLREIGSGGMGTVYEARHAYLRRRAAIKVIASAEASEEEIQRFDREAQLTSQLSHPNSIVLFDYGRTERGDFYYAMEYVPGITLEQLVQRQGALAEARVRHLLLQICGALAEAHELGFVHRDIKPSNIMLTTRGGIYDFIKVLDFGLAKPRAVQHADTQVSKVDALIGTPRYMAPECFVGSEASVRSDIYALGCVAHFLLSGREPFVQQDSASLALAHLTTPPPPLTATAPALEHIVMRCLAKAPEQRFSSMRQLMAAVERSDVSRWSQVDAAACWERLEMREELVEVGALRLVQRVAQAERFE